MRKPLFGPRRTHRHGVHALKNQMQRRGIDALDGRSRESRALKLWRENVTVDLGNDLSAQQRTLVDLAAVDVALIAAADSWIQANAGQVISKRRKSFAPLIAERTRLASHLQGVLQALGLERRAPRTLTLSQILASGPPKEAPKESPEPEQADGEEGTE